MEIDDEQKVFSTPIIYQHFQYCFLNDFKIEKGMKRILHLLMENILKTHPKSS